MIANRIHDGDGLLVAGAQATRIWYYLHEAGFDRIGDECAGKNKRFTCRLFPPDMEAAPASVERYASLYDKKDSSVDLEYFLQDLPANTNVFLSLGKVSAAGGNVQIDQIGGALVSRLMEAGFRIRRAAADHNYLLFSRARTDVQQE